MRLLVCDCKCVQTDRETERVNKGRKIDIKKEEQGRGVKRERERLGDQYSWPLSLFKSTLGEISSLKCVTCDSSACAFAKKIHLLKDAAFNGITPPAQSIAQHPISNTYMHVWISFTFFQLLSFTFLSLIFHLFTFCLHFFSCSLCQLNALQI